MISLVSSVALVGVPVIAYKKVRRRLCEDAEKYERERKELSVLRKLAHDDRIEAFHERNVKLDKLVALQEECESTEKLANRLRVLPWLESVCVEASDGAKATRSEAMAVRSFAEARATALATLDVEYDASSLLPADKPPWRAPWQKDERAADIAAVVAHSRQTRLDPLSPVDAYARALQDLETRTMVAIATAANQDEKSTYTARLAKVKARTTTALRAVLASSELYDERRDVARLEEAKRSADAAQRTESETRKLRLAAEDDAKEKRRCARAIDKLAEAFEKHTRAVNAAHASSPPRPQSLSECRNLEDPVSLEPLTQYSLTDLCVLPSQNCIKKSHLLEMTKKKKVDPFTNVELPPGYLPSSPPFATAADRRALSDLIERATAACKQ